MTNRSGTLYVGATNSLDRRVNEHIRGKLKGFTQKYRVNRLIYYEQFANRSKALAREKEIKGWRRAKKKALIEAVNPRWTTLILET